MSSRWDYWAESARHSGSFDFGTSTHFRGKEGGSAEREGIPAQRGTDGIRHKKRDQQPGRRRKNQEQKGVPALMCADGGSSSHKVQVGDQKKTDKPAQKRADVSKQRGQKRRIYVGDTQKDQERTRMECPPKSVRK